MDLYEPASKPAEPHARILMLHGHGQSGQFFFHKTRFMQQVVGKTMIRWLQEFGDKESNSEAVDFFYPSAPLPANPDDPSKETSNLRAWGHGDPEQDQINGLENSLQFISKILEENGPFIGIVGFSTGAAVAALISSLLEKKESASGFRSSHAPLKFTICFSGFKLENPIYTPVYEPTLQTPILNVVGTLDTMIEPEKSFRLQECGENIELHQFEGTHYVPRSQDFLENLREFIWKSLTNVSDEEGAWEDC